MTTEQRILKIEAEIAALKARLVKQAQTMERQDSEHTNDAFRYQNGKRDREILEFKEKNGAGLIDASFLSTRNIHQYDIWKVRRLSDNTVWTVGDKCNQGMIRGFQILDDKLWAKGVGFRVNFLGDELDARFKPPLFTTADGVEILQGDKFWYWYDDGEVKEIDTAFHEWKEWPVRRYSTRNAAEKAYNTWLAEQPILSLNDISRFIDIGPYCELEALVKDKIAKR